jgi:hypothetical protein
MRIFSAINHDRRKAGKAFAQSIIIDLRDPERYLVVLVRKTVVYQTMEPFSNRFASILQLCGRAQVCRIRDFSLIDRYLPWLRLFWLVAGLLLWAEVCNNGVSKEEEENPHSI